MPLVFTERQVSFEDVCTVEGVATVRVSQDRRGFEIDLSACTYLHTALLQLLLTARPRVTLPADAGLARWIASLLDDGKRELVI
jgi:hypothetical protein